MKALVAVLLFAGCATHPRALLRHEASVLLDKCLKEKESKVCFQENAVWCTEKGLDRACGADVLWWQRF